MRRLGVVAVAAAIAAALTAGAIAPQPAAAVEVDSVFSDDDWNIHEPLINAIAAAGITYGCNPPDNDHYCPDRPVTREQMAAFLTRAFGYTVTAPDPFSDDDGSIFEGDIERIAAAGITTGCNPPTNDRFCPYDPVTRAQMASFLTRALGLSPETAGPFVDVAGNTHLTSINAIAAAGITRGCNPPDNDRFCPDDPVTRAQMASLLARALGLTPLPSRLSLRPGTVCDRPRLVCTATLTIPAGRSFEVREGWYNVVPFANGEESALAAPGTSFAVTFDGVALPTEANATETVTLATREWRTVVTGVAAGPHVLRGVWRWEGVTNLTVVVAIDAG